MVYQVEPRLDRGPVHQGSADITGKQPSAARRHSAVQGIKQAATAAATRRANEFEAFTRRSIDQHMIGCRAFYRCTQERQRSLSGMFEIGDEPARCCHLGPGQSAKSIQRGNAEQPLEPRLTRH